MSLISEVPLICRGDPDGGITLSVSPVPAARASRHSPARLWERTGSGPHLSWLVLTFGRSFRHDCILPDRAAVHPLSPLTRSPTAPSASEHHTPLSDERAINLVILVGTVAFVFGVWRLVVSLSLIFCAFFVLPLRTFHGVIRIDGPARRAMSKALAI